MKFDAELVVGWFVLLVIGGLIYLSLQFGQVSFAGTQGYHLTAEFSDAGGLQGGARVELAGVEIGRVVAVTLTENLAKARVTLSLQPDIQLRQDSRAAIRTAGLIGERFIHIENGVAADTIPPGGQIMDTQSPVDILDTVGQVLFGNIGNADQDSASPDSTQEENPWELGLD